VASVYRRPSTVPRTGISIFLKLVDRRRVGLYVDPPRPCHRPLGR
jgi:hypothetical protein